MSRCKNCGKTHTNGTKFCGKSCRTEWQRKHEKKGAKNKALRRVFGGAAFDMYGNTPDDY